MISYTLGGPASNKEVFNGWNDYFIENEKKLIYDLINSHEFKSLWELGILNKNRLNKFEKEFKKIYVKWTFNNISNSLREEIITNMESFVFHLKNNLKDELYNFTYYLENFNKKNSQLFEELKSKEEFKLLWINGVLDQNRIDQIGEKFKSLYIDWFYEDKTSILGEKILEEINLFIYELKRDLINEGINFIPETEEVLPKESEDKIIKEEYTEKINFFLGKIKSINSDIYFEKKEEFNDLISLSSQKIKLFYNSLRLLYIDLKKEKQQIEYYRESISNFYEKLKNKKLNDLELIGKIENFLKDINIDENSYNKLHLEMQTVYQLLINKDFEQEKVANIINALKDLNYFVLDEDNTKLINSLQKGENITLNVKQKNYAVLIKLSKKNQILTRFVKKIKTNYDYNNITDSEKIIDNDNLKYWCTLANELGQDLQNKNIFINRKIIENDEKDILYVVDRDNSENKEIKYEKKVHRYE